MRFERGVLIVRAASVVWAQELSFVAPTIIARLSVLGLEVESLRFRVGPIDTVDRPLRLASVKTLPARRFFPRDLDRRLADVDDSALRETIACVASANLAWQAA